MKNHPGHSIFVHWVLAILLGLSTHSLLAQSTPVNFKVAFIGDQGLGTNANAVLNLIKSEGAHAVVHCGDIDYADDPAAWETQVNNILGANFPYFVSVGNHDENRFYGAGGYQSFMQARMNRLGIIWDGDLGVKSSFQFNGIFFILTGPDVIGSGHDIYIRDKLAADNSIWSISSWHKNMRLMQVGGKSDDTGWGVYEESRKGGAIIATGHEHSYSRTHLLSNCQSQTVASTSNTLTLSADMPGTISDEGRSFVFVSGLGGASIRDQELSGAWWASIYTSTQGALYGALFGVFNFDGTPNMAHFYFKNIADGVIDDFYVISTLTPPPAPAISSFDPTSGSCGAEITINGSDFSTTTQVKFNATASQFAVVSNSQIRATVPASATTGKISVTTAGGTATSADDFSVLIPPAPAIASFTPVSGAVGTQVTISGTDFTCATQVAFNSVVASNFTVLSNTQIHATVPTSATTGKIQITTPGGVVVSNDDFIVTVPPQTRTFNPAHDAYVNSSSKNSNYGRKSSLRLRNSAQIYRSYLKFVVSGVTGTIHSAKLRLKVTAASNDGGSAFTVSNFRLGTTSPWTETNLNYNNAPIISGNPLSSVGAITAGQVVEFDVTAAIAGNNTFSFGLQNASSTTAQYGSKEASSANRPQLVIQFIPGANLNLDTNVPEWAQDPIETENAEIDAAMSESIVLTPNYPNPFNAQTKIEFSLPKESQVRLIIFNVMGQLVRTLLVGTQPPGLKIVLWDGKDEHGREAGSGMYILQLEVDQQKLVRKLNLQK